MKNNDLVLLSSLVIISFLLNSCQEGIPDFVEGRKIVGKGMSICVYEFRVGEGNKWSGTVSSQNSEDVVWVHGLEAGNDGISTGINPDLLPLLGICPDISVFQFVEKHRDGSLTPITFEGGCTSVSESYASTANLRCYREKR